MTLSVTEKHSADTYGAQTLKLNLIINDLKGISYLLTTLAVSESDAYGETTPLSRALYTIENMINNVSITAAEVIDEIRTERPGD